MVELQGRVVELTTAQTQARRVTFVDVKGIGKPSSFASDSKQFSAWRFKLGNFLEGIMSGMREALEWAQDQDIMIESDKLEQVEVIIPPGADAKDAGRQLYAVLAQLCEGEALDLVQNVESANGWEAWRVLAKRFDPQGAGRRRNVMSQLIQPGSYDVRELNSAMNKWEEKVRLYEKRSGTKLPEDMKSAILTEMTKGSLKEHLILNAAKLKDYDSVREDIHC
jgi:hypothetical protein